MIGNAVLMPGRPDKHQHYDPTLPSNGENYWFSWLKRQLILQDIHTISIEPPFPFRPRYSEWMREFERCDLTANTLLVGHSCGAGFIIRYLSEHPNLRVGKVILIAPWLNPFDNPVSDTSDFFHFTIDPTFAERTQSTTAFLSEDDDASVLKSADKLRSISGIRWVRHTNKGHFTDSTFPDLFQLILA
jgi:predicted alpha/beta hydrolase family esterase